MDRLVDEDICQVLARFHREIVAPDVRRIVREAIDALEVRMGAHFDAIHKRFDRLDLQSQVRALEARLDP